MARKSSLFSDGVALPHCPRPGVLVYLEDWDAISGSTTLEQRGILMDAVVSYVRYGEVPDFNADLCLRMAWGFISPKLDRDQEDYNLGTWTRRYNAYKRNEEEPLGADQWLRAVTGRNGPLQYEYESETVSDSESVNGPEPVSEPGHKSVSASVSEAGAGAGEGIAGGGNGGPPPPPLPPQTWGETTADFDYEQERQKRMRMLAGYQ